MSDKNARSFSDILIANCSSAYFSIVEPIILRYQRFKNEHKYKIKNTNPLITVCIPTYNRGPILIERAVKSVLSQTYQNFELMIVGDHCTDDTQELVSKIDDDRIKFFNMPSRARNYKTSVENHWYVGGAVPANMAMKLASGLWIARVDDDDTWTSDHLEKLLKFAEDGDYEFVSALYEKEENGKRVISPVNRAKSEYYTRKPSPLNDSSPYIGGVSTWLKRSYLSSMKYNQNCWRKKWNKVWDIDLVMRIYSSGARIGFLNEVVSFVLPRPGETSVGLQAYKETEKEKLEHYKFEKN